MATTRRHRIMTWDLSVCVRWRPGLERQAALSTRRYTRAEVVIIHGRVAAASAWAGDGEGVTDQAQN
jgi:hypothetical protein